MAFHRTLYRHCRIYWGSASDTYAYAGSVSDTIHSLYGTSIIGAGDINYDNHDDFIISAPGGNIWSSDPGFAHIYYGRSTVPESTDVPLEGEITNDQFGFSIAAGGDLNGDRYNDLAIGAFKSGMPGYYAGKVYVYSGKSSSKEY